MTRTQMLEDELGAMASALEEILDLIELAPDGSYVISEDPEVVSEIITLAHDLLYREEPEPCDA